MSIILYLWVYKIADMLKEIVFIVFIIIGNVNAQKPIKIIEEKLQNRLVLYAENQSEIDYDVKITVTGKNIRQSSGKPRFFRVPSASKVLIKTLIVPRGKQPSYTYKLEINDSLSKRSLKRPVIPIKIKPKKRIIIYTTDICETCEEIINGLTNGIYIFESYPIAQHPKIKDRLVKALANTNAPFDSVKNPIINLAGRIFVDIDSYHSLMEEINKEK